jgi:hypothetical protein
MPTVTPKPVRTSEDAREMLRFDLDNENETIRNYRERVRQCEALGEFAMAEQIRQSSWMSRITKVIWRRRSARRLWTSVARRDSPSTQPCHASLALLNRRRTVAFWLFPLPCHLPRRNSARHMGPPFTGASPASEGGVDARDWIATGMYLRAQPSGLVLNEVRES